MTELSFLDSFSPLVKGTWPLGISSLVTSSYNTQSNMLKDSPTCSRYFRSCGTFTLVCCWKSVFSGNGFFSFFANELCTRKAASAHRDHEQKARLHFMQLTLLFRTDFCVPHIFSIFSKLQRLSVTHAPQQHLFIFRK